MNENLNDAILLTIVFLIAWYIMVKLGKRD